MENFKTSTTRSNKLRPNSFLRKWNYCHVISHLVILVHFHHPLSRKDVLARGICPQGTTTFSQLFHNLFMNCSRLVHDLFTIYTQSIHNLVTTCPGFFHNLFTVFHNFFITCSGHVKDLFLDYFGFGTAQPQFRRLCS